MRSVDFVHWFKGYLEISEAETISAEKVQIIRNHLDMVFRYEIDPSFGEGQIQQDLTAIHSGISLDLSKPLEMAVNC